MCLIGNNVPLSYGIYATKENGTTKPKSMYIIYIYVLLGVTLCLGEHCFPHSSATLWCVVSCVSFHEPSTCFTYRIIVGVPNGNPLGSRVERPGYVMECNFTSVADGRCMPLRGSGIDNDILLYDNTGE